MMFWGLPVTWPAAISRSLAMMVAGISSRETETGLAAAMCRQMSRASVLKSSVLATKSVSQLISRITPTLPPRWM
jgi:hypothetical protein